MSTEADYDTKFYEEIEDGSRRSASAVVPHVRRLLPNVRSIIDFGCGSGVWLAEFERSGVKKIHGLDFGVGAESQLAIQVKRYCSANLGAPILVEMHDLCVSLEVAEHLDSEFSEIFVDNLVQSAPRILFSAAVPNQGGHHHLNEQPPEYWIAKFARRGFECLDVIRPMIWEDDRICWWYKQNMLLFVNRKLKQEIKSLSKLPKFGASYLIHPNCFQDRHQQLVNEVSRMGRQLPSHYQNWHDREVIERLKVSRFWKLTRPLHRMSDAAKQIDLRKA